MLVYQKLSFYSQQQWLFSFSVSEPLSGRSFVEQKHWTNSTRTASWNFATLHSCWVAQLGDSKITPYCFYMSYSGCGLSSSSWVVYPGSMIDHPHYLVGGWALPNEWWFNGDFSITNRDIFGIKWGINDVNWLVVAPYPSEKSWISSVGIMKFPTEWKNKNMFQTTNQSWNSNGLFKIAAGVCVWTKLGITFRKAPKRLTYSPKNDSTNGGCSEK